MGKAVFVTCSAPDIPTDKISSDEVERELELLENLLLTTKKDLEEYLSKSEITDGEKDILSTHIEILDDPELQAKIQKKIAGDRLTAAKSIDLVFEEAIEVFRNMANELFAERAADFADVKSRLIWQITGSNGEHLARLDPDSIPIFDQVQPSDISILHQKGIAGFLVENLSYTSHAAILSRAMKLACVANIHDLKQKIAEGDLIMMDGESGLVIQNPDDENLEYFAQKIQIQELIRSKQMRLKNIACETKDKRKIQLSLNIGLPEEITQVAELGSSGVGLFRTEFLLIEKNRLPDEEEQFAIYKKMAEQIAPKTLTIRSFDIGGDKISHLIPSEKEDNPYLGNRGIRLLLSNPSFMRPQIRAILRASAFGRIRLMFPMVIDVDDFLAAKQIVKSCADELYEKGIDYDPDLPLGCMIEIPSAALSSDSLAQHCDFLSIGTNDLVQYTLAVDRNNDKVSRYFIQHHPAVLKLIRSIVIHASKHGTSLSVCGEMASIKEYIPLLIGMGITELSVSPGAYYDIKSVIPNCDERLSMIVKNFDFSTSLPNVDELIYRTLKPYYAKQESIYDPL
nr:phosphoenolpyruvate-protein phosphotransferase system enzyme [Candidatus Cloacimonadota bacterium]